VFTFNLDLGQVIISTLIVIVGWFVRREITQVGVRLDRHETTIAELVGKVQNVIGYNQAVKELSLNRRDDRANNRGDRGGTLD
jgi:hypothetical protein